MKIHTVKKENHSLLLILNLKLALIFQDRVTIKINRNCNLTQSKNIMNFKRKSKNSKRKREMKATISMLNSMINWKIIIVSKYNNMIINNKLMIKQREKINTKMILKIKLKIRMRNKKVKMIKVLLKIKMMMKIKKWWKMLLRIHNIKRE